MEASSEIALRHVADADFPSEFGQFRIHGFEGVRDGARDEAAVLVMGEPQGPPPLVRIHSQCFTGDVFHSLRCDCRAQLELALEAVAAEGRGIIIYEMKEGRGIGLMNKLRAYSLQDQGADTVEANERLGFEPDLRVYQLPAAILRYFGVAEVRLLTNNPDKIAALEQAGIRVAERIPCQPKPRTHHAVRYLKTKKRRMGHLLEL